MEDSFRARVDKVFGSLASSSSNTSSSSLASSSVSSSCLWSLTDEEIERREWKRERDSPDDSAPKPYPPNLDGFFSKNPNISSSSQTQSSSTAFPEELEVVDLHDYNDNDKGKQSHGASSSRHLVKPDDHDDEEWDIRSSIGLDSTLDLEVPSFISQSSFPLFICMYRFRVWLVDHFSSPLYLSQISP
ncbi:hypothetical protein CsSME_00004850 [Camellia sinensis var. sinensis]